MNQQYRLLISISAMSVLTLAVLAQDTPGPKPTGSELLPTFSQSARVADRLTLFEQDVKIADFAITARIHEEVSTGKNLSVHRRNVKIITTGGRVVLQGTVNTTVEKILIGDIAIRVRRRENVDNQLNVRPSPSTPTALRVVR